MDLGVIAMKGYSTFPEALGVELHYQMILMLYKEHPLERESNLSVEMQMEYSTYPTNLAFYELIYAFPCCNG